MDTGLLIVRFNLSLPYLAYNLRWKAAHDSKLCNTTDTAEGGAKAPTNTKETPSCTLTTENPNIPLSSNMPPIPFEGHRKAPPRTNKELEKSIKELHEDLEKLVRTVQIPKPNLSKEEHQAIRNLSKDPTLTIIRSDKGGEMVVRNMKLFINSLWTTLVIPQHTRGFQETPQRHFARKSTRNFKKSY